MAQQKLQLSTTDQEEQSSSINIDGTEYAIRSWARAPWKVVQKALGTGSSIASFASDPSENLSDKDREKREADLEWLVLIILPGLEARKDVLESLGGLQRMQIVQVGMAELNSYAEKNFLAKPEIPTPAKSNSTSPASIGITEEPLAKAATGETSL